MEMSMERTKSIDCVAHTCVNVCAIDAKGQWAKVAVQSKKEAHFTRNDKLTIFKGERFGKFK